MKGLIRIPQFMTRTMTANDESRKDYKKGEKGNGYSCVFRNIETTQIELLAWTAWPVESNTLFSRPMHVVPSPEDSALHVHVRAVDGGAR